jgi:hypothetical protein
VVFRDPHTPGEYTFGAFFKLRDLNATLARLERKLDEFSLDFEETVNKVNKSLRRIASERATIERANHPEAPEAEALPSTPADGNRGNLLSDRQRQIQQQILKRRAGLQ